VPPGSTRRGTNGSTAKEPKMCPSYALVRLRRRESMRRFWQAPRMPAHVPFDFHVVACLQGSLGSAAGRQPASEHGHGISKSCASCAPGIMAVPLPLRSSAPEARSPNRIEWTSASRRLLGYDRIPRLAIRWPCSLFPSPPNPSSATQTPI
jgi:hypothetical protein